MTTPRQDIESLSGILGAVPISPPSLDGSVLDELNRKISLLRNEPEYTALLAEIREKKLALPQALERVRALFAKLETEGRFTEQPAA